MGLQDLRPALLKALKTFERKTVEALCDQIIQEIYRSAPRADEEVGGYIMQDLRSKRMFDLMQLVGDALLLAGAKGFKIRKLYAQALIDQNYLMAAHAAVDTLIADTSGRLGEAAREEWMESRGQLGRIYKQQYINAILTSGTTIPHLLKASIDAYYTAYIENKEATWHGINAVAMLLRGKRDGIELEGYLPPEDLAMAILALIQRKYEEDKAQTWDFATACEACVAIGDTENALEWLSGYARMPKADAFELASSLRQLEEVWQLDSSSNMGQLLLPILRAELLKRLGGRITLTLGDIQKQKAVSSAYQKRAKREPLSDDKLEKAFTKDSFRTFEWLYTGTERCLTVAQIGRPAATGTGTGFLVKGEDLHASLKGETLLLTNAHVVSEDPIEKKALRPAQAVVTFEVFNPKEKFKVKEIVWTSGRADLDATLLRFEAESLERLQPLTDTAGFFPLCEDLPVIDPDEEPHRIFIIGHPNGGTLQISLYDNLLLDHQEPYIHYRTPTEVGNSGSPVFNEQWELIGLHHAGSSLMSKLHDQPGTYEANEGIWIQAIKKGIKSHF